MKGIFYCKAACFTLAAALIFGGCSERPPPSPDSEPVAQESVHRPVSSSSNMPEDSALRESIAPAPQESGEEAGNAYIAGAAAEIADRLAKPGMTEFEKAKAAFDYIIETTTLTEPAGLELWRVRGSEGDPAPDFVENRSLSVLLFNIGMCEDYAAAFTVLLRAMGIEAEYLPGLTYSTEGFLVDHAWTVAKIDGVWYHLDTQLEDNVSRHGAINYRYFMRGDATLAGSHSWGQRLIDSGLLAPEQNQEIAKSFIPPACPQDYPTPARKQLAAAPPPDSAAINTSIEEEIAEFEAENGPLPPIELNTVPPVFGIAGYGPAD